MVVSGCKGIVNALGENNCFLNVVIQSLWHTSAFREAFKGHCAEHPRCDAASPCFVCALHDIFCSFEHTEAPAVRPDALRRVLGTMHARFAKGRMNDAAETFSTILEALHSVSTSRSQFWPSVVRAGLTRQEAVERGG